MGEAIRLAVFDMAGTTVRDNDAVNLAFRDSIAHAGLSVTPERVNQVMGMWKPEAISILLTEMGETEHLEARVDVIHDDFVARMVRNYETNTEAMPNAIEVFAELRGEGVKVALNTGFNRRITNLILDALGWDDSVVDSTISSDEVEQGRPSPLMIRELMTRFGVAESSQVAKVGDTPADLHEGSNARCSIVAGITHGTHTREQLAACPHTHLVDSLPEFYELVHSMGR